jgi:MFS family permease
VGELWTVLGTRQVPLLLTTSMIGRLPTAMATLAVLLLIRDQGGSYTLAGGLAALFTAGAAVGQPMLARVVDRRGQPGVLLVAGATSTAAFVVLAASGAHQPLISALAAAVAGLGTPPLEPCLRSLWPHVFEDGHALRAALSLDTGVQEMIFVVGPLLTLLGVATLGGSGGVLAAAVFGLAGTLGFAATTTSRSWRPTPRAEGSHVSPIRVRRLNSVFLVALGSGVPVGALAIVAAVFAHQHGSSSITGWALAANATGALVAGLYGAIRPTQHSSAAALTAAGLALAVGYLPLALPLPVAVWIAACALAGFALPVVLTLVFQRIQKLCPPGMLTEANAWVVTAFGVGAALAALLAGVATDHLRGSVAIPVIVVVSAIVTAGLCLSSPRYAR